MTLYTHLPIEDVMAEKNDTEVKYKDTPSGTVMIQKNEDGAWIVQRLVSPDPNDYLNDSYQPGTRWNSEE
ncbi:hypothetical protein EPH95_02585 [Salicibibacter halophilus]|uniref:Uncharacterized protein n=1 Tax=Salicibibacter halophilus TaxID=2502791 RepID=A0A514LEB4_9BACI|nr:YlzJ-like family protein [Salicibibacter halophilus]QDI90193.1 hypothetical protein EPH95_02585 [Salicibibacter halophilus]